MTDEQLTAIEQRVQAATPGPWSTGAGLVQKGELRELVTADHDRVIVAMAYGGSGHPCPDCTREDREFIAKAREDVPALLAEVRRLRDEALRDAWEAGYLAGQHAHDEWAGTKGFYRQRDEDLARVCRGEP